MCFSFPFCVFCLIVLESGQCFGLDECEYERARKISCLVPFWDSGRYYIALGLARCNHTDMIVQ